MGVKVKEKGEVELKNKCSVNGDVDKLDNEREGQAQSGFEHDDG